jgi:ATP-dependent Clp protease ATP-binding subunit ClpX
VIARRALEKGVGARGLRSIVEEVMLDLMFDLPEQQEGTSFMIDVDPATGKLTHHKAVPVRKETA